MKKSSWADSRAVACIVMAVSILRIHTCQKETYIFQIPLHMEKIRLQKMEIDHKKSLKRFYSIKF